jgi:hypothetical protein
MASQNQHHLKPLSAFSQALKSLFGREKDHVESEKVDAVAEVREGLKDIKAGRVREIKSVRDLLQDE